MMCIGVTYEDVHADPDAAGHHRDRHRAIDRACEAVVIVGSDYTDIAGPTEPDLQRPYANLGAPVLLVVSGFGRSPEDVVQVADIATAEIVQSHATTVGVLANRCDADQLDAVRERLAELGRPVWALPEIPLLSFLIVGDLMTALDEALPLGDEFLLGREAEHMLVGGMNTEHVPSARATARPASWRRSSRRAARPRHRPRGRRLPLAGGHRAQRRGSARRSGGGAGAGPGPPPAHHPDPARLLRDRPHRGSDSGVVKAVPAQEGHRAGGVRALHRRRGAAARPRRPLQRGRHAADVRVDAGRARRRPPASCCPRATTTAPRAVPTLLARQVA